MPFPPPGDLPNPGIKPRSPALPLEEFEAFGLKFEFVTRDLHHSEKNEGNVMTEYEKNFSDKGQPIYSAHVRF